MDFLEAVHLLAAESERQGLPEQALAEFDRWVEWQGGTVGGVPRVGLDVEVQEQALVFRTEVPPACPYVVTRLTFRVREPDWGEGLSGVYQLFSGLDGKAHRERVNLNGPVSLEVLGHGYWWFTGADFEYNGEIPRRLPQLDPRIPY